jgi:hypothetical protein
MTKLYDETIHIDDIKKILIEDRDNKIKSYTESEIITIETKIYTELMNRAYHQKPLLATQEYMKLALHKIVYQDFNGGINLAYDQESFYGLLKHPDFKEHEYALNFLTGYRNIGIKVYEYLKKNFPEYRQKEKIFSDYYLKKLPKDIYREENPFAIEKTFDKYHSEDVTGQYYLNLPIIQRGIAEIKYVQERYEEALEETDKIEEMIGLLFDYITTDKNRMKCIYVRRDWNEQNKELYDRIINKIIQENKLLERIVNYKIANK